MKNKKDFLDELIKNVPIKVIEETFKKDIERNEILYKVIYHELTAGESLYKIKRVYGEIGVLVIMRILSDNKISVPKEIMEEFYSTEYIEQLKKDNIKAGIFGTLFLIFLIVVIFLVISDIFFLFNN